VKVERQFHFAFLDKWLCFYVDMTFLDYKIIFDAIAWALGDCGNYCGCLQFSTPEERRHTLQIGVSMGVPSGRVPGPIFALKCPKWLSK
jgi:hypothetical protein